MLRLIIHVENSPAALLLLPAVGTLQVAARPSICEICLSEREEEEREEERRIRGGGRRRKGNGRGKENRRKREEENRGGSREKERSNEGGGREEEREEERRRGMRMTLQRSFPPAHIPRVGVCLQEATLQHKSIRRMQKVMMMYTMMMMMMVVVTMMMMMMMEMMMNMMMMMMMMMRRSRIEMMRSRIEMMIRRGTLERMSGVHRAITCCAADLCIVSFRLAVKFAININNNIIIIIIIIISLHLSLLHMSFFRPRNAQVCFSSAPFRFPSAYVQVRSTCQNIMMSD